MEEGGDAAFFTEEIMEMDWREETLESILAYFNKNPKGAPWADIAVYYPAGEVLSAILKKAAMISEKSGLSVFLAPAGDDRPYYLREVFRCRSALWIVRSEEECGKTALFSSRMGRDGVSLYGRDDGGISLSGTNLLSFARKGDTGSTVFSADDLAFPKRSRDEEFSQAEKDEGIEKEQVLLYASLILLQAERQVRFLARQTLPAIIIWDTKKGPFPVLLEFSL